MAYDVSPLPGQSAVICMADARDQLAVIEDTANVAARLNLIFNDTTDEFLGVAGIHGIGNAEPEFGIWLKEPAHRLGYGREAIGAIVQWAPAHIGAAALIYPVAKQNLPSRRLAESLHGTIVGERNLRKSSGVVLDEVAYRIPAVSDWFATAERFGEC